MEMDKPTREWDQGKSDAWPGETGSNHSTSISNSNIMTRSGESKSSSQADFRGDTYDHDFPDLIPGNAKKKNSRKSDISDKESITSDISVPEGKKKPSKPRVNVHSAIFNRALLGVGLPDRIAGKDGAKRDGKRPTMQHYTPKGRTQTSSSRKSPRTPNSGQNSGVRSPDLEEEKRSRRKRQ